jgi:hypothetical protein
MTSLRHLHPKAPNRGIAGRRTAVRCWRGVPLAYGLARLQLWRIRHEGRVCVRSVARFSLTVRFAWLARGSLEGNC